VNKYEGMFIFPEGRTEEELDNALDKVKEQISAIGGEVQAATKLGRRPFARPMNKQTGGMYYVVTFTMTGEQLADLRERLKFSEDIFRAEFYRAENTAPVRAVTDAEAPAAAES
jgi:ribosomal protein S6